MTHDVLVNGERLAAANVTGTGCESKQPFFRAQRTARGDTVVFAGEQMMRNGEPVLGNLTIVDWGESALLRMARTRIEVAWRDGEERCAPTASARCRLCFGSFSVEEIAVACRCTCVFHEDCDRVRADCPACGAPQGHGLA